MLAHFFVGFSLAVSDRLTEVFRLCLLETEKLNESLNSLGRNMAFALQYLYQEACIHTDRSGKHTVAECRIQRLFQFVEVLQELAVVGIVVYVYLISCEHDLLPQEYSFYHQNNQFLQPLFIDFLQVC